MNSQNLIRKIEIAVLLVLFLLVNISFAQMQYYAKSYDFPVVPGRIDVGRSLQADLIEENTWSIAGYSNSSSGAGAHDWMLMKLLPMGFVQFSTLLGFSQNDSCFSHVTTGNNYIMAGLYSNSTQNYYAAFSILDANGNHILSKKFRHLPTQRSQYRQVVYNNGKIALTGFSNQVSNPIINNIIVSEYNANTFTMNWSNIYNGTGPAFSAKGYTLSNLSTDGSYIVAGTTVDEQFIFIMKLNNLGNPVWMKTYRPLNSTSNTRCEVRKIISDANGISTLIGWTNVNDDNYNDIWIFNIDPMGNVQNSYTYGDVGFYDYGYSFVGTHSDMYFTGYTKRKGTEDLIIGKFSTLNPDSCWAKLFDITTPNDRGYDIKIANYPYNGLGTTGQTQPTSSNSIDAVMFRTDFKGKLNYEYNCLDSMDFTRTNTPVEVFTESVVKSPVQDSIVIPMVSHPTPVIRTICTPVNNTGQNNTHVKEYTLKQNYPNPFNPSTNIEFSIPKDGFVSIKLYDITGRLISTLINENKFKGSYIISFNASELPGGVYFYKLSTNNFTDVKKMTLVK